MNNYINTASLNVKSTIRPEINMPLDARCIVDSIEDLYKLTTWAVDNKAYLYDGLIVSVKESDDKSRPQVFVLHDLNTDTTRVNSDFTIDMSSVDDANKWLINNWTRLGFVLDEPETGMQTKYVKLGWVLREGEYIGPDYIVKGSPDYDNVYTTDTNGVNPGNTGYIRTMAKEFVAIYILEVSGEGSQKTIYIPIDNLLGTLHIKSQKDGLSQASILDFNGSDNNFVLNGKGSINIYPEPNQKGVASVSLQWQDL